MSVSWWENIECEEVGLIIEGSKLWLKSYLSWKPIRGRYLFAKYPYSVWVSILAHMHACVGMCACARVLLYLKPFSESPLLCVRTRGRACACVHGCMCVLLLYMKPFSESYLLSIWWLMAELKLRCVEHLKVLSKIVATEIYVWSCFGLVNEIIVQIEIANMAWGGRILGLD